jgi:hypothetical protein
VRLEGDVSELRFQHAVHLQAFGNYAYDGGFLEASSDGGATWTRLDPLGGYPFTMGYSQGNPYPGVPAWSGRTDGWEEVVVPVSLRGDVLFRFHFVSDFSGSELGYDGWSVDALLIRSWERTHAAVFESPVLEGEGALVTFEVIRCSRARRRTQRSSGH